MNGFEYLDVIFMKPPHIHILEKRNDQFFFLLKTKKKMILTRKEYIIIHLTRSVEESVSQ